MADYSEFPTTPTAWQEQQWQMIAPLETEDRPQPQRQRIDRVALVAGLLFLVLAVSMMTGLDFSLGLLDDGGVLWVLLIGAGIALLGKELRTARSRG